MTLKENGIYMKHQFLYDEHLKTLHEHFDSKISEVDPMKLVVRQKRKENLKSTSIFAMNLNTKSPCKKSFYYLSFLH